MSIFTRAAVAIVLLISLTTMATAQSFSKDRLKDWEFRFYACKYVVINASIVIRLMEKYRITDQSGINELQSRLRRELAKAVIEHEKAYRFTDGEAEFVSDLTFAVVSGMVSVFGLKLSDPRLMQSGSDVCISTLDGMIK